MSGTTDAATYDDFEYNIKSDSTVEITKYIGFGGNVIIPDTIGDDAVTSIGKNAFNSCSSLTSVTIPDSVTSIGDYAFSSCSSLTSITIGNNVTSIGDWAFYSCESLISVTIPDSVTSIGDYAFHYCSSLTSITIGNNVTSIGKNAFNSCSSLTSVTIPDSVTSIGYSVFLCCSSLTSVTIPDSVTSIGDYAFSSCSSLTSITIGNNVTSIGEQAFSSCSSLTSIIIPGSMTSICDYAFHYCSSLTSITIGNNVTSIGAFAFSHCSSLVEIIIPNNVTYIGIRAFDECHSLSSIGVSSENEKFASKDGVLYTKDFTSIIRYPQNKGGAFICPSSVNSIGDHAFYECSSLSMLIFEGDAPDCHAGWAAKSNPNLKVYFIDGSNGFTTPTWQGLSAISVIPPGIPANAYAAAGLGSARTSWSAPSNDGNAPFLNYEIWYGTSNVSGDWTLFGEVDTNAVTITELEIGTTFYFGVKAVNIAGVSDFCVTEPVVPCTTPAAPQISAVAGDGSVTLSWNELVAPENGWGNIDYYVIYGDGVDVAHVTGLSTVVTSLMNGQSYSFTVAAHNAAGVGDESSPIISIPFTVPDAPAQLEATPGDGQVTLTWAAPDFDGGRPIDYYIIYMDGVALPGHPTEPTSTITGLTNGQSYSFTVAAHNSAGVGPQSVVVESIPFTFSDAPTGLRTILDSGKVTLSWTAPSFDGGRPIDHYVVYQDGVEIAQTTEVTHVVEGLNNGQSYVFSVAANSAAGIGLASLPVAAAPSLSIPSSPTSVVAHQLDGGIVMEWMDPIINGGYPITYEVFRGTSVESFTLLGTTSEHSFVDMTCTPGIQYFYHVVATNQMGSSEPSEAVDPISTYSSVLLNVVTDSSSSSIGIVITISGEAKSVVGNPIGGMSIDLAYSTNNGQTWVGIPSVTTSSSGTFSTQWIPTASGIYMLKASLVGDSTYLASTSIMSLAVTSSSDNNIFTVQSNSTISGLSFDSATNQLSFTVSGEDGTYGYTRIVISKELVVNGTDIKVSLDGAEMNYQLSSTDESWVLYFTYHHSTHGVTVSLGDRAEGADVPADGIPILVVAIIAAIVGSYAIIRWRKRSD